MMWRLDSLAEAMFRADASMDGVPVDLVNEAWRDGETAWIYKNKAEAVLEHIAANNLVDTFISPDLAASTGTAELVRADIIAILEALGLGTHARPYSTHDVVHREILPAIERLQSASPEV